MSNVFQIRFIRIICIKHKEAGGSSDVWEPEKEKEVF